MLNEQTAQVAQTKAEEFQKAKAREFLTKFFEESLLGNDLYDAYLKTKSADAIEMSKETYVKLLIEDYYFSLGKYLGLSYALGFMDATEGVDAKIYRGPSPTKLHLPK